MKLVFSSVNCVFDTECGLVNTLCIENPALFCELLRDLQNQLAGYEGTTVLSKEGKILSLEKKAELLSCFFPFHLSTKALLTKIGTELEKKALSDDHYSETVEILGRMDAYLSKLTFEMSCDIGFEKMNIGSFIKAAGITVFEDYNSLPEKIIDYFELVTEFLGEKLFITVNLRSFLTATETEQFLQTVVSHGFHLIMLDNQEYSRCLYEKRIIIDSDFCIIQ